jgi:RNase P subunit RPR2
VIRTMFTCTETGEPLVTRMTAGTWPARDESTLVSIHCPKCGQLHRFGRSEAILVLEGSEPAPAARTV